MTTLYLSDTDVSPENPSAYADKRLLVDTRGSGVVSVVTTYGDTDGTASISEIFGSGSASGAMYWWLRVNAVTISGSITCNMRCAENNMSANQQVAVQISRYDSSFVYQSTVLDTSFGTEMSVTTERADNWSASPTNTAFTSGDWLRIMAWNKEIGTGAQAYFSTLWFNGTTGGASGDTYVTFTETISEYTATTTSLPLVRSIRHPLITR